MSVWVDIKNRLSVDEVLSQYIQLQPSGVNFRAICPFHQEKSPSLMVNPERGIWHCFGCGQGGDIFAFVTQFENLSSQETLKKLAKQAGVTLEDSTKSWSIRKTNTTSAIDTVDSDKSNKIEKTEYEKGLELLDWGANLYHQLLLKTLLNRASPITQYCIARNLSQKTIETFRLGYAPKGNLLVSLAQKHKLDLNLLLKIGLLKQNSDGQYADKFSDRLMIPISLSSGKVCGFTGRILPYDKTDRPKYLNSPQSEWFNKSQIWFGWNLARPAIIRAKQAIIVEGNMDVIAAFQNGLPTTIASQGTSFTTYQLTELYKITKVIWIAFDNDEAGKNAAKKCFIQATEIGFEVKQIVIPQHFKDLDEYLTDSAINNSSGSSDTSKPELKVIPYLDYVISQNALRFKSPDSAIQRSHINEVIGLLKNVDQLGREQAISNLSKTSGISANTLMNMLESAFVKSSTPKNVDLLTQKNEVRPEISKYQMLDTAWQNYCAKVMEKPNHDEFLKDVFALVQAILNHLSNYEGLQSYILGKRDELEVIRSQLHNSESDLWKLLMIQIDAQVDTISLNSDLIRLYLVLKARPNE